MCDFSEIDTASSSSFLRSFLEHSKEFYLRSFYFDKSLALRLFPIVSSLQPHEKIIKISAVDGSIDR